MSIQTSACPCCDLIFDIPELIVGHKAYCSRCDHFLLSSHSQKKDNKAIAFALSALIFLCVSLPLPFLTFQYQGREQETSLIQSGYDLLLSGFPLLAFLLTLFVLIIPTLILIGYLLVIIPLSFDKAYPWMYKVTRWMFLLQPWEMAEVFLIGVLVSLVKISGMADLVIGLSFQAYILFTLCLVISISSLDRQQLWLRLDKASSKQLDNVQANSGTAISQGLQCCRHCGLLHNLNQSNCHRCNAKLTARIPHSLQKTLAWLIAAIFLYLPANIYPIMHTSFLGVNEPNTIIGGALTLWQQGSYPIALIIFIASVFIPISKILALFWLIFSVRTKREYKKADPIFLYRITEIIGRWSMIDVFVVAVLASLVQLGGIIIVLPGIATSAFAGVVILTIFSVLSFDSRLIWDRLNTISTDN